MSAESDAINDAIVEAASNPKDVRYGSRGVTQHSLADLMKAAEFFDESQDVTPTRPGLGLRFQKITRVYT